MDAASFNLLDGLQGGEDLPLGSLARETRKHGFALA